MGVPCFFLREGSGCLCRPRKLSRRMRVMCQLAVLLRFDMVCLFLLCYSFFCSLRFDVVLEFVMCCYHDDDVIVQTTSCRAYDKQ